MKKLFMVIPLVFLLCFTFACQDKEAMAELEAMKAQAEVEEQNKALVMQHYEAWYSGDAEAINEIFSPDYVYHSGSGQDYSKEQMMEWLKPQMEAHPDATYSVEDIFAKGDKVVSRYIFKGTYERDTEGWPPATGQKLEYPAFEIWRVENGKIVESWEIQAVLTLYQQLGFELKLKEGEK